MPFQSARLSMTVPVTGSRTETVQESTSSQEADCEKPRRTMSSVVYSKPWMMRKRLATKVRVENAQRTAARPTDRPNFIILTPKNWFSKRQSHDSIPTFTHVVCRNKRSRRNSKSCKSSALLRHSTTSSAELLQDL